MEQVDKNDRVGRNDINIHNVRLIVQSGAAGFDTGKGEKLSTTQATPG